MKQRRRIYYSAAQRAEIWDRWKAGESMSSIGGRFDRESSSVFSVLAPTGGIRPPDRKRADRALSLGEREEISLGLNSCRSLRQIAGSLGRSPSTISREVQRNGGPEGYRATRSDQAAWDPDIGLGEARGRASEARKKATDGDDPAGERLQRGAEARAQPVKSFTQLADSYFTACETGEWKPRKKKKRASTLASEKWLWTRHIKPELGDLAVEDVTPAAVKKVLRTLVATGRESTSNKVRAQIRQIFNFAIDDDRVAVNPIAKTAALGDEAPRQRVLKDDEIRTLWTALTDRTGLVRKRKPEAESRVFIGEPVSIALKLLLVTLVRRAEVSGAARSELDLETGVWMIPGARTKSGRPHLVPLSAMAVDLFRRAMTLADEGQVEPSPFVFPSPRDRMKQPVTPAALTHALRYVREALRLERLTPHDLRRTGATNMASERLGISPFLIGRVLSHSTELGGAAAVTLTTYAIYDFIKEKRASLEAWAGLLSGIISRDERKTVATPQPDIAAFTMGDELRERVVADPKFRQALIAELLGLPG